jgi:hypothetical protein
MQTRSSKAQLRSLRFKHLDATLNRKSSFLFFPVFGFNAAFKEVELVITKAGHQHRGN